MTVKIREFLKNNPISAEAIAKIMEPAENERKIVRQLREKERQKAEDEKLKRQYPMSKTVVKVEYTKWIRQSEFQSMITLTLPDGNARNQLALEKKLDILTKRLNKVYFGQHAASKFPENTVSFVAVFEEHATGGLHIHTLFQEPVGSEFCKLKLLPQELDDLVHSLWNKITGAQQIDEKSIDDDKTNQQKIEYCLKHTFGNEARIYFHSFHPDQKHR